MAFGPLFPTKNFFSWVGIDIISETDLRPNQTNVSAKKTNSIVGDDAIIGRRACYKAVGGSISAGWGAARC